MSTWRILVILAAVLSLLSLVGVWWHPKDNLGNRTSLVWVSDNNPARADQIATFNQENPQDRLQLDYSNSGLDKILLQCSSGVGPDLFDIYDRGEFQTYVEAGVLWDITDEAKKGGFSFDQHSWPGLEGLIMYRGRQYAYPCNIGTSILIYNKNVFDYYGIPYPAKVETWDELITLGLKVSTAGTGKPGLDGPIYGIAQLGWQYFFASEHGEYFDSSGRLSILGNAALKRAFEYHRDAIFKYKLTPTSVELLSMGGQGGWGTADFTQFEANNFAMILSGEYSLIAFGRTHSEQLKELESSGRKVEDIRNPLEKPLRLGAILLPGFAGEPPCCEVGSRLAGINAYSPHREQALAFLRYLSGPSYARLVNQGKDDLPGNSQYAELGLGPDEPDLARVQMHEISIQAMANGYVMRESPFLLKSEVTTVLQGEISRLESDPVIGIDVLLADAQRQLARLLQRNLDHDPALRKLYTPTIATGTAPATGGPL